MGRWAVLFVPVLLAGALASAAALEVLWVKEYRPFTAYVLPIGACLSGNILYVVGETDYTGQLNGFVYMIDKNNGSLIKHFIMPNIDGKPNHMTDCVVVNNYIYVAGWREDDTGRGYGLLIRIPPTLDKIDKYVTAYSSYSRRYVFNYDGALYLTSYALYKYDYNLNRIFDILWQYPN
ncbi:MAG: hypothetical protein ACP5H5_09080, partial [Pyrobaculum sp.]